MAAPRTHQSEMLHTTYYFVFILAGELFEKLENTMSMQMLPIPANFPAMLPICQRKPHCMAVLAYESVVPYRGSGIMDFAVHHSDSACPGL